ncbi:tubulin polyglutamylase TTLL11-like isoform X2 [Gorilla gorilla gorilla]|uniref:tubulin polyglutamylase TTLL11-like isoform X2 n=1 Tax=Gorilla gorilla gorilla TaxID=9595 RepID=UPI003009003E
MAAAASVTGRVTWAASPMRSLGLGRRLSLPGPRLETVTAAVNPSLSDHGNGLGRGTSGSGCSGGSLVAGWGGGAAAAAAVALALAPALSAMRRGSSESELAARWEAEAVAAAKAAAKAEAEATAETVAEHVRVDAGTAGEPECKAGEEQPKALAPALAPAQPSAAEEGDTQVLQRPPPTLPPSKPKPVQGLRPHGKPRGKGRSCKRSSGHGSSENGSQRPVTVDSSKARTSLDALKISIRQLKWKEFPFGRRLPCDIYWHGVSFHDNDIFSGQVNKFPGMTEMVRKITLSRAVRTMQNLFPEEYNFYPRSWILPDEFQLFVAQNQLSSDPFHLEAPGLSM